MRTTFYFVRHAESLSNIDPLSKTEDQLSEAGSKQAISVASRFKHLKIESIFTSKILRAELTAKEIQKVTNVVPVILDFFGERKGTFSSDLKFTHVESFDVLKERLAEAKAFLENRTEKNTVLVSHAIFLKSLTASLMLGESLNEEVLHKIEDSLVIDNTGVSKLIFNNDKKKWRIISWNDLGHLAE